MDLNTLIAQAFAQSEGGQVACVENVTYYDNDGGPYGVTSGTCYDEYGKSSCGVSIVCYTVNPGKGSPTCQSYKCVYPNV